MLVLVGPSHAAAGPGAFPTPAVTDAFTRSNNGSSLGANWGQWWNGDGPLGINGNQAYVSTNDYGDSYYNVATYVDTDVSILIPTLPPVNSIVYLGGRIASPNTGSLGGYQLTYTQLSGTDTIILFRIHNATETSLVTYNQNLSAGNGIGMRITGNGATVSIESFYYNGSAWVSLGTYSDTNANRKTAAGYGAIGTNHSTTRLDDFRVGSP